MCIKTALTVSSFRGVFTYLFITLTVSHSSHAVLGGKLIIEATGDFPTLFGSVSYHLGTFERSKNEF